MKTSGISYRAALIALVSATLTALCASPRRAVAYAATGAGYTVIDSDESGGPVYAWDDISTSGTALELYDDTQISVDLPFSFTFMGASYSSVSVCSNGFLQFDGTDTTLEHAALPNSAAPNNIIAALWRDLFGEDVQPAVRHATLGTAPNRRFVVSWFDWAVANDDVGSSWVTFQIALYEGSGDIRLQYQSAPSSENCTVGIENSAGTSGLQYLYDGSPAGNALNNSLAIRFSPSGGPQAPTNLVQSDDPWGSGEPPGFIDMDGNVSIRAAVSHSNTSTSVQAQVEVKPVASAFDGTGLLLGNLVPGSGGASGVTKTGLTDGDYKWRVRTVAGDQVTAWVNFGTESGTDFTVDLSPPPPPGGGGGSDSHAKKRDRFCLGGVGGPGHALWLACALLAALLCVSRRRF